MFSRIAGPYDRLNHLFSGGVDFWWRHLLVRSIPQSKIENRKSKILDLACGTGDVTLVLQRAGFDAVGGDFCEPMLERARAKGVNETVVADALNLPFPDQAFDAITVAFGYRNFEDRARALREMHRVLKPEGSVHILEFSQPYHWFRPLYFFYLRHILPKGAKLLCRDQAAYEYLSNSIKTFPEVEEIGRELDGAGFQKVSWIRPTLGIVAIHHGVK
jgi:demethylmenaquinone methyltransferase / 2-methoxy-6-polyprenyl-1,4-benzoquinol methylase